MLVLYRAGSRNTRLLPRITKAAFRGAAPGAEFELPSTSPDGASLIIAPDTRCLAVSSCDTGWVAETEGRRVAFHQFEKTVKDRFFHHIATTLVDCLGDVVTDVQIAKSPS
jgi:hypothetical protein